MARVTIEDCLRVVPNRFHVVMIASKRARNINAGSDPLVSIDNDKPTVLALREVADQLLTIPEVYHKRHMERSEPADSSSSMMDPLLGDLEAQGEDSAASAQQAAEDIFIATEEASETAEASAEETEASAEENSEEEPEAPTETPEGE